MKDFLEKDLVVGSKVLFIETTHTGNSARRKKLYKGVVEGFSAKKVKIRYEDVEPRIDNITIIFPRDCVIINWED